MAFYLSSSKKFTLNLIAPAVVFLATIILLLMFSKEFSFPRRSFANVENAETPLLTTKNTEPQQKVSQGIAPCKLTFDGKEISPSNNIVKYNWNFGDGETAEGQRVSHLFNLPGTYSVTLQTKTSAGAIQNQQIVVNIEATKAFLSQTDTNIAD